MYVPIILLMLCAVQAQAAELVWDYASSASSPIPPTATIRRGATANGPFTAVATIPSLPSRYTLGPVDNLWYQVSNLAGASNAVQYTSTAVPTQPTIDTLTPRIQTLETRAQALESRDVTLGQADQTLTTQLTALTARVTALEQPAPPPVVSGINITATQLNANQIQIRGLACTSLRTSGTGLDRLITCVP